MKRIASVFVLLVGCLGPSWAKGYSLEVVKAYNAGVRYFNAKDFSSALPYFDQVVAAEPAFVDARYARAACLYSTKQSDRALSDLNEVIRLQPANINAVGLRGAIFYETEQYDYALQDFQQVLSKKPRDAQALLGRGVILMKKDQVNDAARDFHAFLKVRPNDPVSPKIRQLLKVIEKGVDENDIFQTSGASGEETGDESDATAPVAKPRRSSGRRTTSYKSSVDAQKILDDIVHKRAQAAESYERKVIRGEGGDVVGDAPR